MVNKNQASLILRVGGGYLIQVRDNVYSAKFKFPGVLSLFGGEIEEGESWNQGFKREIEEEISGIDLSQIPLEHRVYHWKKDLAKVEKKINKSLNGNLDVFRGFRYDEQIPSVALGIDKHKKITYRELFENLKEDHYLVGEVSDLNNLVIHEGSRYHILEKDLCISSIFYPTDKIALLHDIAINNSPTH